jgi:hypothetical protein
MRNFAAFVSLSSQATLFTRQRSEPDWFVAFASLVAGLLA